jgi:hypothetical protein
MKNLFKILMVALILATFSLQLNAQAVNTNLPASAVVLAQLQLTKSADVDFKNIAATTPGVVRLNPTGVGHAYVGVGATTGQFTIQGSNGVSVLVTYPGNITLVSGGNNLVYNLWVYGNSANNQLASTAVTAEGVAGNNSLTLSGTGFYYLYIGGAVGGIAGTPAALAGQAQGTYTANANFTVTYN